MMNPSDIDKLNKIHQRLKESENQLAMAVGEMGEIGFIGRIGVWPGAWSEYRKMVKLMLRLRSIREYVESKKEIAVRRRLTSRQD